MPLVRRLSWRSLESAYFMTLRKREVGAGCVVAVWSADKGAAAHHAPAVPDACAVDVRAMLARRAESGNGAAEGG